MTSPRPGFGVMLPTLDPSHDGFPSVTKAAVAAESWGFDSIWVGDHLVFHSPYLEALTTLSAAGAVTEGVALGTGVLQLPLRPLAWTAKQVSTFQTLHADRMILGVGVGGENPAEWAAAGQPLERRGERMDGMLGELPAALGGEQFRADGRDVPALRPNGLAPPLWIGGRSMPALRRAARFGAGYLGLWLDADGVESVRTRLDQLTTRAGRSPIPIGMNVVVHVDDCRERARRATDDYLRGVFDLPLSRVERWVIAGDRDEVVMRLRGLRAAGVRDLVLLPAGRASEHLDLMERLAELRTDVLEV